MTRKFRANQSIGWKRFGEGRPIKGIAQFQRVESRASAARERPANRQREKYAQSEI